jgi:hypothetical protein
VKLYILAQFRHGEGEDQEQMKLRLCKARLGARLSQVQPGSELEPVAA